MSDETFEVDFVVRRPAGVGGDEYRTIRVRGLVTPVVTLTDTSEHLTDYEQRLAKHELARAWAQQAAQETPRHTTAVVPL